jgi:hypothetical protein
MACLAQNTGMVMTSEWVKLTAKGDKPDTYVNLANASAIFAKGDVAEIWFLSGSGEEGKIQVKESPDKIIALLNEVKNAHRA